MSAIFKEARESLLAGEIDLLADEVRCVLVDAAPDIETAKFLVDLGDSRVAISMPLEGKSVESGVFDAKNITITNVKRQFHSIVLFIASGSAAINRLIAEITSPGPAADEITVEWDRGENKIFRIG